MMSTGNVFSGKVMGHYLAAVCRPEDHVNAVPKIIVRLCNVGMTAKLGSASQVGEVISHLLCPAKKWIKIQCSEVMCMVSRNILCYWL